METPAGQNSVAVILTECSVPVYYSNQRCTEMFQPSGLIPAYRIWSDKTRMSYMWSNLRICAPLEAPPISFIFIPSSYPFSFPSVASIPHAGLPTFPGSVFSSARNTGKMQGQSRAEGAPISHTGYSIHNASAEEEQRGFRGEHKTEGQEMWEGL